MAEWARRVFAMLFASAVPVERSVIARMIGRDAPVEAVIDVIRDQLGDSPIEVTRAGSGWMLRTRRVYAEVVRAALGGSGETGVDLTRRELAVLAAIAYHQPVTRADLGEIFGQTPGAALLAKLKDRGLVAAGPRGPSRGAPHSFVTTPLFLATFDYDDLEAFIDDCRELDEPTE
jgi:segregation and condensation protein B